MFDCLVLSRQYRGASKAKFVSSHFAQEEDAEDINVAVLFEGYSWDHKDMGVFQIAKTVLGESSSWSTGGPGKGMRARTTLNRKRGIDQTVVMNRVASVELANTINHHFTDSGLFGLHLSGIASSVSLGLF